MRTLLLWSLLGSCAAVGAALAGVVVLAVDPVAQDSVGKAQASVDQSTDPPPVAKLVEPPAREIPLEPPVSTQIAPLSAGIKEVGAWPANRKLS